MTRYSNAFPSTKEALGRSLTLKELAVCHTPFLSLYLLCKETVLYPTTSPFLPFPWFCQIVAVITPVLNFFSGTFLVSIFTHPFSYSDFISTPLYLGMLGFLGGFTPFPIIPEAGLKMSCDNFNK